ncbi:hybrid sensor histidine kinase/response regulator [Teichococcus oryzae]|uniref:hybrid sensor histidine kinase/response regulator n=1 Tax=Teichococcus oryzae TaxID=1608942 RepID=UPI001376164A|nr:response regulator [Pseudoroseomonas oryzae]
MRKGRLLTFQGPGVWLLALLGWLACTVTAWTVAERSADRVEANAKLAALARAQVAAEAIEQNLMRMLESIRGLSDLARARQILQQSGVQDVARMIEAQLTSVPACHRFGVLQVGTIDNEGWLVWSSAPGWQRVYLGDRPHFLAHRSGGGAQLYVSAPLTGRTTGRRSLQFSRPLLDRDDRPAGVLVVSVDPERLSQDLTALSLGGHNTALILRRDGTVLARGQEAPQQSGDVLSASDPLMQALAAGQDGGLSLIEPSDGREKLIGFRILEDAPLAVLVSLDAATEIAGTDFVRPALRATALAFSVLLLAALALSLLWLDRRRTLCDLEEARREREATQQRLVQSQRMEALGRLAGGVAHDFNNVLQAILGGAKLLGKRPADEATVRKLSRMMQEAAERGASVTRRLLAFARRVELRAAPVRLDDMLRGLQEVLTHTLGREVRIELDLAPGLPPALADGAQLETVLINLAINARDAMQARPERRLCFRLREAAPEDAADATATLAPGRYLSVAVEDTGCGMDAATLAQAMEPFFTTKPKGKGTGLGLAMAKGFAEQSGGALAIRSQPGEGTVVLLWLPVAPAPGAADDAAPHPLARASGHILLVDDEAQVREVLSLALREQGYAVFEAADGPAAVVHLESDAPCDALVSDLAMPGMDGLAVLRAARQRRPGLPALLITGYAGDAADRALGEAAEAGPLLLLHKPVDPEDLAERLSGLLREHGQGAASQSS